MPKPRWHATTTAAALLLLGSIRSLASVQVTPIVSSKPSTSTFGAPSTCSTRSINYITQTLPQQCLTTNWASYADYQNAIKRDVAGSSSRDSNTSVLGNLIYSASSEQTATTTETHGPNQTPLSASSTDGIAAGRPSSSDIEPAILAGPSSGAALELETDSPLDNANFLSFEEWKRQNLAKSGQSAENLDLRASGGQEQRRRPGSINNALDSLGEDAEIDIDFGGFVNPGPMKDVPPVRGSQLQKMSQPDPENVQADRVPKETAGAQRRSRDAGKTCKERTNYASYDCAATTLKTNPECKSSSAVLVENKDTYMLNICSAQNKFFIIELCDAILIDTVVLANFEFFSSMFRSFRVSVSDRYPVKLDKWRELGVYEARNSRQVQAFLVENPLIWARYLRVEFLTHYGNEYYCPVSLLRVHGTTMMEEFNTEVKNVGAGEDLEGDEAGIEGNEEGDRTPGVISAEALKTSSETSLERPSEVSTATNAMKISTSGGSPRRTPLVAPEVESLTVSQPTYQDMTIRNDSINRQLEALFRVARTQETVCFAKDPPLATSVIPLDTTSRAIITPPPTANETTSLLAALSTGESYNGTGSSNSSNERRNITSRTSQTVILPDSSTSQNSTDTLSSSTNSTSTSTGKIQTSSTHPPTSNPPTQESFFKSVHKRLQLLESNSTLSLQYIEEQSRILRDAFSKVEKRQLAKTSTFFETLNTTVLTELHKFHMQYDQIWQSTVLELSSQREQSQHEVSALSARLSLLADEIVFQKRMAILQFLLILLCLGLVIFSKHGSTYLDLPPVVQNAINKSSANLSRYTPHFDSAPTSPSASRPSSRYGILRGLTHRRSPSEESYAAPGPKSPGIEYSPPTPESIAGDINSSPGGSHKDENISDDIPELETGMRPMSAPGLRDAKGLQQKELIEGALLPSDATVKRELNGVAKATDET